MSVCPKCEYEFDEKAIVMPDIKIYTLADTPVCCICRTPFRDGAYWDEKKGYICKGCVKDGAE